MRRRNNYGISGYQASDECVQPCLPAEAERDRPFTGLEDKQLRFLKIGHLIPYLLTLLLPCSIFNYQTASFPFAIGLILLSEALIRKLAYPITADKNLDSRLETRSFLIMTLAPGSGFVSVFITEFIF